MSIADKSKFWNQLRMRIGARQEKADALAHRIMRLMAPTKSMEILSVVVPCDSVVRAEYLAQFSWLIPFQTDVAGRTSPVHNQPVQDFKSWMDHVCPSTSFESAIALFGYSVDISKALHSFSCFENGDGLGGLCYSSNINKNRYVCVYYDTGDLFTIAHECGHALQFARYPDVPYDWCELYSDGFATMYIQNDSAGFNLGHNYFSDRARDLLRTIQLPRKNKYPFPIVADLIASAYFALGDNKPADELAMMDLVHGALQNPMVGRRLAEWPNWHAAVTAKIAGGDYSDKAIKSVGESGQFPNIAAAIAGWNEPGHSLAYPSADLVNATLMAHRLKYPPKPPSPEFMVMAAEFCKGVDVNALLAEDQARRTELVRPGR